jgi:hypothetical protein
MHWACRIWKAFSENETAAHHILSLDDVAAADPIDIKS